MGIDVSLGALPFEESLIDRASSFAFGPGLELRTCSAEDLIVMKLFASRPLDVREAQLAPLAEIKQQPEIMNTLVRLRDI